eukprot:gb/GEZN01003099.1/.p1 GENE.gb/GEZN01003099.1/~~gb/GEZN01003099.1/.p1  ORF type:complete len:669 (-),score=85.26 gb/GEZN01003099.1/:221-2227(-)
MPSKKKKKGRKQPASPAQVSPNAALVAAAHGPAHDRKLVAAAVSKTNKEVGQDHMLAGVKYKMEGNREQAMVSYRASLAHDPGNPLAWYNLGVAYAEENRVEDARKCYESAVKFEPKFPFALNNLATYHKDKGQLDQALSLYQRALQVEPAFYNALNNISVVYHMQGQLGEAQRFCELAVDSNPKDPEAHNNLASFYLEEGRGKCPMAVKEFERCIELDPEKAETLYSADHNRLLAMNFLGGHDDVPEAEDLTATASRAHLEWGVQFEKKRSRLAYREWGNDTAEIGRVVRVGYLSSDFRTHPVADFIEAPLRYMDIKTHKIETFCYMNGAAPDKRTAELRVNIDDDHFRILGGRDVREICEMIRQDKIDILVELGGHSAGNRLDVMVLKPAPVQVTWIGYPNTTGLTCIDYRITDHVVDPVSSSQPYSETIMRMPEPCGFSCYTGPADCPDVAELPALKNGYITFGSFTLLSKVTSGSFALWCMVLKAVPTAQFCHKAKPFRCVEIRKRYLAEYKRHGVDPSRIKLLGHAPSRRKHLELYGHIDVALDTFPYCGTTTSCEALYMGVPVLTLRREVRPIHSQNVTSSLMTRIGRKDFIATSKADFVAKAVAFSKDLDKLAEVRSTLRPNMLKSPLCDGKLFVSKLAPIFHEMWNTYCVPYRQYVDLGE